MEILKQYTTNNIINPKHKTTLENFSKIGFVKICSNIKINRNFKTITETAKLTNLGEKYVLEKASKNTIISRLFNWLFK